MLWDSLKLVGSREDNRWKRLIVCLGTKRRSYTSSNYWLVLTLIENVRQELCWASCTTHSGYYSLPVTVVHQVDFSPNKPKPCQYRIQLKTYWEHRSESYLQFLGGCHNPPIIGSGKKQLDATRLNYIKSTQFPKRCRPSGWASTRRIVNSTAQHHRHTRSLYSSFDWLGFMRWMYCCTSSWFRNGSRLKMASGK